VWQVEVILSAFSLSMAEEKSGLRSIPLLRGNGNRIGVVFWAIQESGSNLLQGNAKVCIVYVCSDEKEAVNVANDTKYGHPTIDTNTIVVLFTTVSRDS